MTSSLCGLRGPKTEWRTSQALYDFAQEASALPLAQRQELARRIRERQRRATTGLILLWAHNRMAYAALFGLMLIAIFVPVDWLATRWSSSWLALVSGVWGLLIMFLFATNLAFGRLLERLKAAEDRAASYRRELSDKHEIVKRNLILRTRADEDAPL